MKAILSQQPSISTGSVRSLAKFTAQFAAVLGTSMTAIGLLMATPAFGQSELQNLTCTPEGQRLVCNVQPTGQSTTFEPSTTEAGAIELTPVTRTALFSPELDEAFSDGLLWLIYLSLPIGLTVAIWRYDRYAREQMTQLVAQVATLERIWQTPQRD
jgi:hypothetical protein